MQAGAEVQPLALAPVGSVDRIIFTLLAGSGGAEELQRIEKQLSAWSELPDPPRIIDASTPHDEVALRVDGRSEHSRRPAP
ncbi:MULTISPECIES: hypothetical protein [unclassified Microbacterium]|uniref:hypothetical protein n=1 Tax=unclassified Microbacterium TaxID=2609290 RepID=UPI000EAA1505|nr:MULTISPECIES: hypothetical protein [unclassified Microbacterium]MBT2483818.1 hypothetical protein [Microbacterium sp. ISL-108]RKN66802.1 hypothetical protein D7252_03800 [Microbacterium sp. CGR2]